MGRKCYVPQCKSGYASNPEKVSIFSVPKDDKRLAQWNEVISRKDRVLSKKDFVCEKHFTPDEIMKEWSSAGNLVNIPLRYPRLKIDAIPSIFPNYSKLKYRKKRQGRKKSKQANKKARRTRLTSLDSLGDYSELVPESALEIIYIKEERDSPDLFLESAISTSLEIMISEDTERPLEDSNSNDPLDKLISRRENVENKINHDENINKKSKPTLTTDSVSSILEPLSFASLENLKEEQKQQSLKITNFSKNEDGNIFNIIWNGSLKPPNELWSFVRIENKEKYVSFGKFTLSEKGLPIAERQILIKEDLTTTYIMKNQIVTVDMLPDVIGTIDELEEILICINSLKLCVGGPSVDKYPADLFREYSKNKYVDTFSNVWRHSNCKLTNVKDVPHNRCMFCRIVQKNLATINRKIIRRQKKSVIDNKNSDRNKTKRINRLRILVEKLKNHIKEMRQKLSKVDKINIAEKLKEMNVPKTQQLLIMQCIDQSKIQNPRNMRFHKNWLHHCLLIYQKNRGMYRFLQDSGILPLPCRRTMHRLNGTDIKSRED